MIESNVEVDASLLLINVMAAEVLANSDVPVPESWLAFHGSSV
jgi:hypothetical protein